MAPFKISLTLGLAGFSPINCCSQDVAPPDGATPATHSLLMSIGSTLSPLTYILNGAEWFGSVQNLSLASG